MYSRRFRLAAGFVCTVIVAGTGSRAYGQGVGSSAAELGITPESMVVGGFEIGAATTVLSRIEAAEAARQALVAQYQLIDAAAAQVTQLAEALFDTAADEQLLAQHEAALQQLVAAQHQFTQLRSNFFANVMDGFPPQHVQRLIVWRSGASHRVPPEFRVADRPAQQWKAIKRALRAERRAIRLGQELAQEHAQLLAEVRSDPALAEAANNLTANLDVMKALFGQFES